MILEIHRKKAPQENGEPLDREEIIKVGTNQFYHDWRDDWFDIDNILWWLQLILAIISVVCFVSYVVLRYCA